jgi:hypothetical protein
VRGSISEIKRARCREKTNVMKVDQNLQNKGLSVMDVKVNKKVILRGNLSWW